MKYLIVGMLLLLASGTCQANGGQYWVPGGLIGAHDPHGVTLRKATIYLSFYYAPNFHNNPGLGYFCKVHTVYTFVNPSDQAADVVMNFPVVTGRRPLGLIPEFDDFKVTANGVKMAVHQERFTPTLQEAGHGVYADYYTWTTRFAAGQIVQLDNVYVQHVFHEEGEGFFGYTLSNGASWKLPIQQIDMVAEFPKPPIVKTPTERDQWLPGLDVAHLASIFGSGRPRITGNTIEWHWGQVTPTDTDDVSLSLDSNDPEGPNGIHPRLRLLVVQATDVPKRVVTVSSKTQRYSFKVASQPGWQAFRIHPTGYQNMVQADAGYLLTDHITASSAYIQDSTVFSPYFVADDQADTAWIRLGSDDGIGQSIRFDFPAPIDVSGFSITNGYCKTGDTFHNNNRVRTLQIVTDTGSETVTLADTMQSQRLHLRHGRSRFVQFVIKSVYPGARYRDTGITELDVF